MKKRLLSLVLSLSMLMACCVVTASAATTEPAPEWYIENILEYTGPVDGMIQPLDNRQEVPDTAITPKNTSVRWTQPIGYTSYRIWVRNDTDEEMTVTHVSGLLRERYSVPANTGTFVCLNNGAIPLAPHTLDFSVLSGQPYGSVAVRVSTVDQSIA